MHAYLVTNVLLVWLYLYVPGCHDYSCSCVTVLMNCDVLNVQELARVELRRRLQQKLKSFQVSHAFIDTSTFRKRLS